MVNITSFSTILNIHCHCPDVELVDTIPELLVDGLPEALTKHQTSSTWSNFHHIASYILSYIDVMLNAVSLSNMICMSLRIIHLKRYLHFKNYVFIN